MRALLLLFISRALLLLLQNHLASAVTIIEEGEGYSVTWSYGSGGREGKDATNPFQCGNNVVGTFNSSFNAVIKVKGTAFSQYYIESIVDYGGIDNTVIRNATEGPFDVGQIFDNTDTSGYYLIDEKFVYRTTGLFERFWSVRVTSMDSDGSNKTIFTRGGRDLVLIENDGCTDEFEELDPAIPNKYLLMDTTTYELVFQPAWASALSRTLMGWHPGKPSQLSMSVPGDTNSGSISSLCSTIGGELLSGSTNSKPSCSIQSEWTQLVNGVPGVSSSSSFSSMSSVCQDLGGQSFGGRLQYCALEGAWTQLSERVPGTSSSTSGLDNICSKIGGAKFGSSSNRFCAVEGYYSQFSTRLVGDLSYSTSMKSTCDKLGGMSFGHMCIVKGIWAQLTMKLPNDFSWRSPFPKSVCDKFEGEVFGGIYCAAKGPVAQLSMKLPGDSSWRSPFPKSVCDKFDGEVFDGIYCAAKGPVAQLSMKLPGDSSWSSPFPKSVCDKFDGEVFDGIYCAAKGPVAQLTTKFPGDLSWQSSFSKSACNNLEGDVFGNRYCAAPGISDSRSISHITAPPFWCMVLSFLVFLSWF